MSAQKKVLFVSRQIASGRAFAEWLTEDAFLKLGLNCEILCYPSSASAFLEKKIPFTSIDSFSPPTEKIDLLIIGTSLKASEDALWLSWAKKNQIPSVCYVDQWVNYALRFQAPDFPDYIWTQDQVATDSLKKELPNCHSLITALGTPALNELERIQRNPQKILTFVTEPSSFAGGDTEFKQRFGLFDLEALSWALGEFEKNSVWQDYKIQIALHPIDRIERVEDYLRQHHRDWITKLSILPSNKLQILSESSAVIGFRTYLLFESSQLAIPTFSIQIGRTTSSDLTDCHHGIDVILTEADLKKISVEKISAQEMSVEKNTTKVPSPVLYKNQHSWNQAIQQILKI